MLRLQHEAVAAERDDDVSLVRLDQGIAGGDVGERGLRLGGGRGDGGHPPVAHEIPRWVAPARRDAERGPGGGSAAGHAHVAADRRARVAAVDDEVVALGLAPDRLVDRRDQGLVALAAAERRAQVGRVLLP